MTQKIMFKKGDLVLYDKFGSYNETVSPSSFAADYATGVIIDIIEERDGGFENSYAEVMKENGSRGFFSLSYLRSFEALDQPTPSQ